ncbi:MAG: HAD family hydrolase [Candidatus Omnitrophota bacterium]
MKRAVFLDRDGVLNRPIIRGATAHAPERFEDFEIYPEAKAAVEKLHGAGLLAIVVTNQPEIARGVCPQNDLNAMHRLLKEQMAIDDIYVCPHEDKDRCSCRKPLPGMLLEAACKWDIDLKRSFMVGDRWRDIGAGNAAGCLTFLIERDYNGEANPHYRVNDLPEAVSLILQLLEEEKKAL